MSQRYQRTAVLCSSTLWVVGLAYIVGIVIAIPIGIYSAYRHYSVFDQAGTFITMVGFSIPPFFTGPLLIVIFSVSTDLTCFGISSPYHPLGCYMASNCGHARAHRQTGKEKHAGTCVTPLIRYPDLSWTIPLG